MRNMKLIDAVIALHDISRLVAEEVGPGNLADDIRNCANRLHLLSIADDRANKVATEIIKQAKE